MHEPGIQNPEFDPRLAVKALARATVLVTLAAISSQGLQ